MRKLIAALAALIVFVLVESATAQQFGPVSGAMSGLGGNSGTTSSFFSRRMPRRGVGSVMAFRPAVPAPLNFNILNMMPTLPSLADTLSLRNSFGTKPQMGFILPKQATPPPPKKK